MSLTIAGTDLGGVNYGLVVHQHVPPILGRPRVHREPLSQADGDAVQGLTYDAVTLKFGCAIVGSGVSDAETKAANLVSFFQARAGQQYTLVWEGRASVTWTVILVSGIDAVLGMDGALFELSFLCPSGMPE